MITTDALLRIDDNCQEVRSGTYTVWNQYGRLQSSIVQSSIIQSNIVQNISERNRYDDTRTQRGDKL